MGRNTCKSLLSSNHINIYTGKLKSDIESPWDQQKDDLNCQKIKKQLEKGKIRSLARHNIMERERRAEQNNLFDLLRKEIRPNNKTNEKISQVGTLRTYTFTK